jgi:hypothetical protein
MGASFQAGGEAGLLLAMMLVAAAVALAAALPT